MHSYASRTFWLGVAERAVKTAAQTAVASVGTATLIHTVPWPAVVSTVALAVADHTMTGSGTYAAVADGLLLGLGAAGLYDAARLAGGAAPTGGRHTASE